ncbi:MAG: LXG domain-containing protein [Coriobacteriia bacterium]|nr:LXG domain-containing protein [Coriobacteriia bacterium]
MRLNNNDLNSMVRRTDTMNDRTQAACLGIVRSASALTGTSAFSGQSANQLKAYLAQVTIRAAGELRELSQETVDLSRQIENTFLQIEPRQNGIVDRQTLTDIQRNLAQHQSSFNRTRDRVNALNRRADRHISASQITGNAVNNSFGRTTRFVDSSLTRIADADRSLQNRAQNLLQRIERFNATLRSINRLSVAADSFNMAKAIGLAVGFSQSGNIAFLMQMLEDPFVRKWLATSYSKWSRLAEMLGVEYETFFARSQRGFDNGVFSWGGEAGVFRGGTSQDIGPFELQG